MLGSWFTSLNIRAFMFLMAGLVVLFWRVAFIYATARIREMQGLVYEIRTYDRSIR
ncbi:hypothetical protein [Thermosulfurimonas dismutans]|nr:hypothetical protein [Thermosulfurimonas dismutans]